MPLPNAGASDCSTGLAKRIYDQLIGDTTRNGFIGTTPPADWHDIVKATCYAAAKGVADELAAGNEPWRVIGAAGEPGFLGTPPFADNGAPGAPSRFRRDAVGNVHLQLNLKAGALGQPIVQLPVGYRPSGGELYWEASQATGSTLWAAKIGTDGVVTCIGLGLGTPYSLAVVFPGDQ